jgi:hypothetical protein
VTVKYLTSEDQWRWHRDSLPVCWSAEETLAPNLLLHEIGTIMVSILKTVFQLDVRYVGFYQSVLCFGILRQMGSAAFPALCVSVQSFQP